MKNVKKLFMSLVAVFALTFLMQLSAGAYDYLAPEKVTKLGFGWSPNDKGATVEVYSNVPSGTSYLQIQKQNLVTKATATSRFKHGYWTEINCSYNTPFRIRVRAVYEDYYGSKHCSAWTAYKYIGMPKVTLKSLTTRLGVKLTMKKVPYISSYTIYLSKSSDSGYKKVATVRPSGSTVSVNLTKIGSSNLQNYVTYHYRVIPTFKVGSSTSTSKTWLQGNFYCYKSYR